MGADTDTAATLGYLARALKAPTIGRVWEQLAATARAEGWSHEDYLAAVLHEAAWVCWRAVLGRDGLVVPSG